jgi:hypothetical protein
VGCASKECSTAYGWTPRKIWSPLWRRLRVLSSTPPCLMRHLASRGRGIFFSGLTTSRTCLSMLAIPMSVRSSLTESGCAVRGRGTPGGGLRHSRRGRPAHRLRLGADRQVRRRPTAIHRVAHDRSEVPGGRQHERPSASVESLMSGRGALGCSCPPGQGCLLRDRAGGSRLSLEGDCPIGSDCQTDSARVSGDPQRCLKQLLVPAVPEEAVPARLYGVRRARTSRRPGRQRYWWPGMPPTSAAERCAPRTLPVPSISRV